MPVKKIIVTTSWDDGHLLDGKLSSLLNDYGIKGTFYVAKKFVVTSENVLSLKTLDKNFEIGAHSLSHPDLTNISIKDAFKEIIGSKKWLEKLLDHKIEMFAYPKGKYNDKIVEFVKQAGFLGARTLNFKTTFPKNSFMMGVGCQASNGSPLLRLKASLKSQLSFKSVVDWGTNAKMLFDHILENGGIWHLWGHSWEINRNKEWKKLEEIFDYVSNMKNVSYLENGQVITRCLAN